MSNYQPLTVDAGETKRVASADDLLLSGGALIANSVATGITKTIPSGYQLLVLSEFQVLGTGRLEILGTGRLGIL